MLAWLNALLLSLILPGARTMQGPSFLQEPPSVVLFSNNTGTVLPCSGDGSPPLRIRWTSANDHDISPIHGFRSILSNGSLLLSPFPGSAVRTDAHLTTYRCVISNPVGTIVSRASVVKAVFAEDYQVEVSDAHTILGNVAVLRCEVSANARDMVSVITWLRDDSVLHRVTLHTGGRYAATSSRELHVSDVSSDDSIGRFYCQTLHFLTGERRTSSAGRIVITDPEGNVPPSIGDTPGVVSGKAGTTLDLACPAQGFPPPIVRWFRNYESRLEELPHAPARSILRFPLVQLQDSGRYACIAKNLLGEDRREILLRVTAGLTVNVRPPQQVVDAGSSATLNCTITGGEESQRDISWRKNGVLLSPDSRVGFVYNGFTLTIRNVRRVDSGMYQCFVTCGEETAQGSAHLSLGAVAPELLSTFFERTMEPGPAVSLSCSASGNPPPQITWLMDGGDLRQVDYAPGSFLDSTGSVVSHLNISSVRVHHGAVYTCIARNLLGTAQHSAALNIYGPPSPRPRLNLTVVAATDVLLRCPVAGYPLTVTWSRGSQGLPPGSRHVVLRNGTLLIRNVDSSSDAGLYTCNADSDIGMSAQGRIHLEVMTPPQIAPFTFPTGLQEGMRAQVACSMVSGDMPITFIWRKDGGPLPQDSAVQEQQFGFGSNLLFSNLAGRHSGQYTCIASNAAAVANATARLVIRLAPVWELEPRDTSVLLQHTTAVHCRARGFPTPTISWLNPSGEMVDGSENGLSLSGNGTLLILGSSRSLEGHYTCRAANGIGPGLSKSIFLRVNVPARFKNKAQTQSGVAGENIVITCEAEGDAPLQITWTARHRPSTPLYSQVRERHSSQGLISDLHLSNISKRDEGTFRCRCTNDFGYDEALIRLVVKEAPSVPRAPTLTDIRSRWLGVAWDATTGAGVLVQYRPANMSSSWSNLSVPSDVQQARISMLLPGTPYLIRLIAVNEVGSSPPSPAIRASTLQEAPERAPTDVSVEGTSSFTAVIRWQPVDVDTPSQVIGYVVSYLEEGAPAGEALRRTVRGAHRHQVVLTRLKTFTRYSVSVCAFNFIGLGPFTPSISFVTFQGVPDRAPENVRCVAVSPQSLRVMWQPPTALHRHGIVEGYRVMYSSRDNPPAFKATTNLETTLHGLRKASNYTVSLSAFTAAGDGVRSDPMFCYTNEDAPGAPLRIKALPMTSDSIIVAWTAPGEPNGVIVKYTVYMSPLHSTPQILQDEVPADGELIYEARRLKETDRYEFWVSASTSVGEGRNSIKVSQSPLSKVPARIAGWSQPVFGGVGDRVVLSCHRVGLPAPSYTWRGPGGLMIKPSQSKYHRLLPDGNLLIIPLRASDAGNYSCIVENTYGRDEVTYFLTVTSAPNPPAASVTSIDSHSSLVEWRSTGDGGSPVTEYVIAWRISNGEWRELTVPDGSFHQLEGLKCGRSYQITVSAVNRLGRGKPSSVFLATTSGSVPGIANSEEFLLVNTTSVVLLLDEWPDGGCPLVRFSVEMKSYGTHKFTMINREVAAGGELAIPELIPGTWHSLRVTAVNEAGSTEHVFTFATLTLDGSLPPTKMTQDVEEMEGSDVVYNAVMILVIVVSVKCSVIAVVICVCLALKRRNSSQQEQLNDSDYVERTCDKKEGHHGLLPPPPPPECITHGRKGSAASNHDYEICPYATFNLPESDQSSHPARDYSLHYRAFNQQECFQGAPEEEIQLKRIRTSKSPPDGLSLEVSCISSQQTLPMRVTPHHRARRVESSKESRPRSCPSRKYDSDSSDPSITPAQSPVEKHAGWKTPRKTPERHYHRT